MSLSPGQKLARYENLESIGAGGMGKVYRAKDARLDRTVAIKVLPEHVADDPDFRQRFERQLIRNQQVGGSNPPAGSS